MGDRTHDDTLVEQIRAGEIAAFERLFHTYYAPLCAFVAAYVESRALAQDVVADLFAWVWEQRAQWRVRGSVSTYLFGAARNRALNARRHQAVADRWKAEAALDPRVSGMGQGPQASDREVESRDLAHAMVRAVAALPERQQQAFNLRARSHLANAEIGAVMGISEKAVEKTLARAYKTLRDVLDEFV